MNILSLTNVVAENAAENTPQLSFELSNFISNLKYMGTGMLVIFLIIGVIILSTILINYLFSD